MNIHLSSNIELFKDQVPSYLYHYLKKRLIFPNPKFEEAQKHGYWTGNMEEYISCLEEDANYLYLPRGFIGQLIGYCNHSGIEWKLVDKRRLLEPANIKFRGILREYQQNAVNALIKKDFATLSAPTGSGKTIIALYLATLRKQPFLVITHTKELAYQWVTVYLLLPIFPRKK